MRKWIGVWIVVGLALTAGVALADDKARSGVDYEGVTMSPAKARQLQAEGAHRYRFLYMSEKGHTTWKTHNAQDLDREIDLLNLLNGLYLSDVQMRHLLVIAARAEKDRRAAYSEAARLNEQLERVLADVKAKLVKDETAKGSVCPPEARPMQERITRLQQDIQGKLVNYESYAKAILTPNQREKVYNYQHCLIPVKNMKDPTRIGQADSGSKNEKLLEDVKKMSADQFKNRLPILLDEHIHGIEKYTGKMSDEASAKEKARVTEVMNKAREMNDLDFQFTKAKLAADIASDYAEVKDRLKAVSDRLNKLSSERDKTGTNAQLGEIGRMLLDERIIPIYAKRLKIYEGFKAGEAIDLTKVEAVASCKGVCSID
ncbi:MAG: hypothetical protein FJ279_02070 [Planctomycetes bacterium]|nr:hypothetical protein [Planctomycetota bacterium]MBM4078148.1 hypothetical protein [Planctomycetota bacterium]